MGLKCLTKTKAYQKLSEAFEKTPLGKINKKINCCLFGEPVDAATGRVYHTNTDFELSGPIPLVWERTYYSDVDVPGALGYNWHHSYNMSIREEAGLGMIFRHPTGRETGCPYLQTGESFYDREEHLEWKHTEDGYTIYNDDEGVYYHLRAFNVLVDFECLQKFLQQTALRFFSVIQQMGR